MHELNESKRPFVAGQDVRVGLPGGKVFLGKDGQVQSRVDLVGEPERFDAVTNRVKRMQELFAPVLERLGIADGHPREIAARVMNELLLDGNAGSFGNCAQSVERALKDMTQVPSLDIQQKAQSILRSPEQMAALTMVGFQFHQEEFEAKGRAAITQMYQNLT